MNEQIKEWAVQAGLDAKEIRSDESLTLYAFEEFNIEKFAELVRQDEANGMRDTYMKMIHGAIADEREACAKLCDGWLVGRDDICEVAKAIRAREEK